MTTDTKAKTNGAVKPKDMVDIGLIIPEIDLQHLEITLVGDSEFITHAWSEKAKREMLDKQMKKARVAKEAKDPWMDFCQSLYWLTPMPSKPTPADIAKAKFGFPAVAFKAAAISAAGDSGLKMTESKRRFHVLGEHVEIKGPPPQQREDMVRLGGMGGGVADIRYRGGFKVWHVTLDIQYNASAISAAQIVNLFRIAGFGIGVGEWRPAKGGQFGRFHVALDEELKNLK